MSNETLKLFATLEKMNIIPKNNDLIKKMLEEPESSNRFVLEIFCPFKILTLIAIAKKNPQFMIIER